MEVNLNHIKSLRQTGKPLKFRYEIFVYGNELDEENSLFYASEVGEGNKETLAYSIKEYLERAEVAENSKITSMVIKFGSEAIDEWKD